LETIMPSYGTADIRNIALVGHSGAGKTSLGEAILHTCGLTNRLGSVSDGTSNLDSMDEEKERGCSIEAHILHVQHKAKEINIVDTPGAPAFVGPAISVLIGVETAVCVISATAGIEVNTRRMMEKAKEFGLARAVVINRINAENVNLPDLLAQVQECFGRECLPINLPTGGGKGVIDCFANDSGEADFDDVSSAHEAVVEGVVGADEALMEKYFGGELAEAELSGAVSKALAMGTLVPVMFTDARDEVGIKELLDVVADCMPSPLDGKQRVQTTGEGDARKEKKLEPKPDGPVVAQVFKVSTDPKSNIKYSTLRVFCGTIKGDTSIQAGDDRRGQRAGQLSKFQGGVHADVDAGTAGDIIAAAKLDLRVGDVLHTGSPGDIEQPTLPTPMFALAIEPKSRADADKVSGALARFCDEDPCFVAERDPATRELVIKGMQDLQLQSILSRMKHYFKLEVESRPPKIPYKETITGTAKEVEYTHKKQTGGAGQYARVVISIEPTNDPDINYEFVDEIFGGAIDLQYRPSVDKGIQGQMTEGVIAGYPVRGVRVRLIDGKTHPVDSKDIAFQIAGREAFKAAFAKANPVLLEPIVDMEVTVPTQYVGDIQGELASRRGRPQGQDMLPGGMAVIRAQAPLSEVADFNSRLSSISQGQGSYSMELSHYEPVPGNLQQSIIAAAKKAKEDDR
jgi:elongation factor G